MSVRFVIQPGDTKGKFQSIGLKSICMRGDCANDFGPTSQFPGKKLGGSWEIFGGGKELNLVYEDDGASRIYVRQ